MKTKIDIKSAMLGLGAGVIVTLTVAAASSSGTPVGRYQIVGTAQQGGGSECFIIDTAYGKVWKGCVGPNCGTDMDFFQVKSAEK